MLGAFLHSSHLIGTTALKVVGLCHWTGGDVEAQRGGVIAHTAGQCISQDLTRVSHPSNPALITYQEGRRWAICFSEFPEASLTCLSPLLRLSPGQASAG